MWTTLIVGCCLGISVHADINLTTTSPPSDIDKDLEKIASICLTNEEQEEMAGNVYKFATAKIINVNLALEAHNTIGRSELRSLLGFPPVGPWTHYKQPSEEELAAAPTIEAYYELVEPHSVVGTLDSDFFHEKNVVPAVAFLEKRIPEVRTIYRRKFSEIRNRPDAPAKIDRKEVDVLIEELFAMSGRMDVAFGRMFLSIYRCRKNRRE